MKSCYDCHSNEPRLRWFDQVAPAYWLAVADVRQGRQSLNFSELGGLPAAQQRAALFDAVNQIQLGTMPPRRYTVVHRQAVISPEQLAVLKNYLIATATPPVFDAAAALAAARDPRGAPVESNAEVRPAPNGVPFFPEYTNWKTISSTSRTDNNTMRVILGNDVATTAAGAGRVKPWPDGTVLAKVAWNQALEQDGVIRTGSFVQVEFMVKDSRKYSATKGWGWGRWKGADLEPYGRTADFSRECIGCHTPMHANDYVFTSPVVATTPDMSGLPFNPLRWSVISSSIDNRRRALATLYGNDPAVQTARTSGQQIYPAGSVLSLVTWRQHDDAHWFGATIPDAIESVEFVEVEATPDHRPAYVFEGFEGTLLTPKVLSESEREQRIAYILEQRASRMP